VYEVYIERAAERDLRRLARDDVRRVIAHVKALAEDPRPSGSRKISGSKNDWRIRVGNYRILYEFDRRAKLVRVMRVAHRREVYR